MLRVLKKFSSTAYLRTHQYSTNPALKVAKIKDVVNDEKTQKTDEALAQSEKIGKMRVKSQVKKPARPPFVKNLLLGKFDTEFLTFPEALSKEGVENLERDVQPVRDFFSNQTSTKQERRDGAGELKLNALHASQLSGGRELNITETCRFQELIAQKSDDIQLIFNENLGVQALLKFGTKQHLHKYLDDIVNGKITMGFAVFEEERNDATSMRTTAIFNDDKQQWVLNGKKRHVVNGHSADLFIVLAKSRMIVEGLTSTEISAFLVERISGGVSSNLYQTIGLTGTDIAEVTFSNTAIPKENLLGSEKQGFEMYAALVPEFQLSQAAACSAISRSALNQFIAYCKDINTHENNVINTELVNSMISSYALNLYVMESMIFLTAGVLDIYETPDCETECSIVKCFSMQETVNITLDVMKFLSTPALETNHWAMQLHRDALGHLLLHDSLSNLKHVIALQALRHAGIELQPLIKQLRNPFYYTTAVLKQLWVHRRHRSDNPALTLKLSHHLHPSAGHGAEWLEYSVLRTQYMTEILLSHHGANVLNKHNDLQRLAECVIDIYGMTAALGRASRSYCIGLANSDCELMMAQTFCYQAMRRIKQRVLQIEAGPYENQEAAHSEIGGRLFHTGKYFPEHPLTRNY